MPRENGGNWSAKHMQMKGRQGLQILSPEGNGGTLGNV